VLARYRQELGGAVSREVEGQGEQDLWRAVSDFSSIVPELHPRSLLISIVLPLGDVQPLLDGLATAAQSHNLTLATVGRVGIGHLLAALWPAGQAGVAPAIFGSALSALRQRLPRGIGMTVLHCPAEARDRAMAWGPEPGCLKSMRAVKSALDPKDILNRGRFLL
jgi:FAD/FMN-containing dehydrogenase